MIPFGYDDQWFPLTDPAIPRAGVAFVGTWHPRRERYLRALEGLHTTIVGSGWDRAKDLKAAAPVYGASAGSVLQRAAIGINILHPHNAGAHNMRTREVAASGALQLTDPGTDGTPLRDRDGCRWFQSPDHLRHLAEHYLAHPDEARVIARRAQHLVGHETYRRRAEQLADLFGVLVS
jgi:spore maturation protein CgeB